MTDTIVRDTERSVARCRVILSMVTLISLCLESMPAVVPRWLFLSGGPAVFDPRADCDEGDIIHYLKRRAK